VTSTSIDIVPRYSAKAEDYQRYRWPFDPQAAADLLQATGLNASAVVVDIGAGTGLSSAPFLKLGCEVWAIEPNDDMRQVAAAAHGACANFHLSPARGEKTGLPDGCADLVVVGRALHWLPQAAAKKEFGRVAGPKGWLAIMAVKTVDQAYLEAVRAAFKEEFGWDTRARKDNRKTEPISYFFDEAGYQQLTAPTLRRETWRQFRGRLLTMAPAPLEGDPHYRTFVHKLKEIFDGRQHDGRLEIAVATEIKYGRPGS
jgi:SAM-dependent methyltransferase